MKLTRGLFVLIFLAIFVVGSSKLALAKDDHDHHSETHEHHENHGDEPEKLIRLSNDEMTEFGIKVQKAGKGTITKEVIFPGEVQIHLDYLAHVKPRYSGVVKRIYKHIGDTAKKGDVLAIVESNENLSRYEIKAPITGTIIQKHFTLGESVEESSNAFAIANLDKVWVIFSVSEDYFSQVKKGQFATILSDDRPLSERLRILYISDVLDTTSRTSSARLEINNRNRKLKPGMYVDVSVKLESIQSNIVIPKTAVQTIEGKQAVFVQKRGRFQPHFVTLGVEDLDNVIVLKGIESGENIVTEGSFILKAELEK
ncbi:MAG: efflux RND transporter periplasmic adaptor subunit, partial [Candidatus Margulisbacteria bacterium]|nr:efflux RND transporter periplasmic adaptor subunit [Candidatus Margulisiibacteriota bacterium]